MTQATNPPAPLTNTELLQRQTELLEQLVKSQRRTESNTRRGADSTEDVNGWYNLAIAWGAYLIIIAVPVAQDGFTSTVDTWNGIATSRLGKMAGLPTWGDGSSIAGGGQPGEVDITALDMTPLEGAAAKAYSVNGMAITSGYGMRFHPVTGGHKHHTGVDVGAPVGTPLYAPTAGEVNCESVSGYGGQNVNFTTAQSNAWDVFIGHTIACYPGTVSAGDKIGEIGNEGMSTGAHSHTIFYQGGQEVVPTLGYLGLIHGEPIPFIKASAAANGAFSVESYKAAIATQESGNDYSLVNPDSGALGKYQFMPSTLRSVAQSCPGVSSVPSSAEFLASPQLQESIMDCYLATGLEQAKAKTDKPGVQCRMLASYHYSGDINLYDNTAPQFSNGNQYPSISSYTNSVCSNVK